MADTIPITHALSQTWIIIGVVLAALIFFRKAVTYGDLLSIDATQELKGVAIIAVLFGHIGLYLVDDHRFLFPLSLCSGVGVNVFLFLSGYGLTLGMMKKPLSAAAFYRKRALKVFVPFWIALIAFLAIDALALHRTYSPAYMVRSLLGFFPRADMASDVNSVFWYITWILLYYLLFPLVFIRSRVWLSALILFVISQALVEWNPSFIDEVTRLYKVHTAAFPLGVLAASLLFQSRETPNALADKLRSYRDNLGTAGYYVTVLIVAAVCIYSIYDSGIGESAVKEQVMSTVTTLSLAVLFAIKRVAFRALTLCGLYSYEIYLFHWPLLSRYDVFYHNLPVALATVAWLIVFFIIGWAMQPLVKWIASRTQVNSWWRA